MWLIGYSILVVFGLGSGFAQCKLRSVPSGLEQDISFSRVGTTAQIALDTLRGLQGIGSAAIVPASVRVFTGVCSQPLTFGGLPTSSEF